jgi:hypothetical protein
MKKTKKYQKKKKKIELTKGTYILFPPRVRVVIHLNKISILKKKMISLDDQNIKSRYPMEEISYDDMYDEKFINNHDSNIIWEIVKYIITNKIDILHFSFPSFVLEKRSFLEKYSDIFLHHDILLG